METGKEQFVDYLTKGLPQNTESISMSAPGPYGNVLSDSLPFPLLVLKDSVLAANIQKMAAWCQHNGFLLAPHGKTTMCPQIFQRQLQAGAWGLTLATAAQGRVAAHFGARRILLANQLVGKANIAIVVGEMNRQPELELYCLVDSIAGVEHLAEHLAGLSAARPLGVLLEWGRKGWRSGVTTIGQAQDLLQALEKQSRWLRFCGFEGFEGMAGVAGSPADELRSIREFLQELVTLAETLDDPARRHGDLCILSVGGSGYLDLVHESVAPVADRFQIVIRSGCYVTHDQGYYAEKLSEASQRATGAETFPVFAPALELWSLVQSLPQEGRALLTFGKRDCSYDLGLPRPLSFVPAGRALDEQQQFDSAEITALNDQHAFLTYDRRYRLSIGDRVVCGISHPCTAFDKWSVITLVDDDYQVLDWYRTYF